MTTKRKKRPPIAIKHPGALNREVGGPASDHLARVRRLAKSGTPEQKKRANLYLNVLRRRGHA